MDNTDQATEDEMFRAFLGFDLKSLIGYMQDLRSHWNGSDARFSFHGEVFSEDHVGLAEDIIEKAKELQELLNDFA